MATDQVSSTDGRYRDSQLSRKLPSSYSINYKINRRSNFITDFRSIENDKCQYTNVIKILTRISLRGTLLMNILAWNKLNCSESGSGRRGRDHGWQYDVFKESNSPGSHPVKQAVFQSNKPELRIISEPNRFYKPAMWIRLAHMLDSLVHVSRQVASLKPFPVKEATAQHSLLQDAAI